jgi:hypothetical protein
MRRTEMLQEIRKMRFEEVYFGWTESRLSQAEAAQVIGGHSTDSHRSIRNASGYE